MTIARFQSVEEVERADFRRLRSGWRRYGGNGTARKAHVYLVAGEGRYAKVGRTCNPIARIGFIASCFDAIEAICIVGPRFDYRDIELALIRALARHAINETREWFELPQAFYASLQQCFAAGCTDNAIQSLDRLVNAPPIDYEI